MIVTYTIFGETKRVKAEPHNMREDEQPEKILWVERGEDMYALSSPSWRGKKVAVVRREDWLRADPVDPAR